MQALISLGLIKKEDDKTWFIDIDGLSKSGTPDPTRPDLDILDRVVPSECHCYFHASQMPPLMYDFFKESLDKLDSKKVYKTSGADFEELKLKTTLLRKDPYYKGESWVGMNSFGLADLGLQIVLSGHLSFIYDNVFYWRKGGSVHHNNVARVEEDGKHNDFRLSIGHPQVSLEASNSLHYQYTTYGRWLDGAFNPRSPPI